MTLLLKHQQKLTREPSTPVKCVSSSVFWQTIVGCICLHCVQLCGTRVDTLYAAITQCFVCCPVEGRWRGDEEIMRDGKWIDHKPHDTGARKIIHLLIFRGLEGSKEFFRSLKSSCLPHICEDRNGAEMTTKERTMAKNCHNKGGMMAGSATKRREKMKAAAGEAASQKERFIPLIVFCLALPSDYTLHTLRLSLF